MADRTRGARSAYDRRRDSDALRGWRERQYARQARSQAWLLDRASRGAGRVAYDRLGELPRMARCGWPLGGIAGIRVQGGRAFVTGTEHCASPWSCPLCTPVIRAQRARDVRRAIEYWQAGSGHGIAFLTLTVPHTPHDPLRAMIDLVSGAWSRMRGGQTWRAWARHAGIMHYIRSMEITWSPAGGWHCHLHVLLLLDRDFDPDRLRGDIHAMWATAVRKAAPERKTPSKRHGVSVEKADGDMIRLAGYMSKTPDAKDSGRYDLAREMTRADRKHARGADGLNPFQFLDDTQPAPTVTGASMRDLWLEYVDATSRRRSITWSRDLRRMAGLGVERTDRQIIDDTIHGADAFALDADEYRMLRHAPSIRAFVLQKTETGEIPLALQVIDACLDTVATRN